MRKNNYYSPELKIQIVEEYLKGGISYESLKNKYNISNRRQIKTWVDKYQEFGEPYFYEEKRGRNGNSPGRPLKDLDFDSLSKDEQIKYLQKQLYHKQLENDVLKKVIALTQKT